MPALSTVSDLNGPDPAHDPERPLVPGPARAGRDSRPGSGQRVPQVPKPVPSVVAHRERHESSRAAVSSYAGQGPSNLRRALRTDLPTAHRTRPRRTAALQTGQSCPRTVGGVRHPDDGATGRRVSHPATVAEPLQTGELPQPGTPRHSLPTTVPPTGLRPGGRLARSSYQAAAYGGRGPPLGPPARGGPADEGGHRSPPTVVQDMPPAGPPVRASAPARGPPPTITTASEGQHGRRRTRKPAEIGRRSGTGVAGPTTSVHALCVPT